MRVMICFFGVMFFLTANCLVSAQEYKPSYRNQIKASTLKFFDPYNPGIELSYERLHGKVLSKIFPGFDYNSSQLSFTYLNNILHRDNRTIPKGYRISFEEKFFIPKGRNEPLFGAIEMVYLSGRYPDIFGKVDSSRQIRAVDSVSVSKQTLSLNVKFGVQVRLNIFVIELSFGAGLKYRVIKFSEKNHPELFYETFERGPWLYDPDSFHEGRSFTINVPFNLKVGFSF